MSEHIDVQAYESVVEGLRLYAGKSLLVDMSSTNYSLATAVPFEKVCSGVSPIASMKAVKNKVEQDGFRAAMLRDGVAVVKFLAWLSLLLRLVDRRKSHLMIVNGYYVQNSQSLRVSLLIR